MEIICRCELKWDFFRPSASTVARSYLRSKIRSGLLWGIVGLVKYNLLIFKDSQCSEGKRELNKFLIHPYLDYSFHVPSDHKYSGFRQTGAIFF